MNPGTYEYISKILRHDWRPNFELRGRPREHKAIIDARICLLFLIEKMLTPQYA